MAPLSTRSFSGIVWDVIDGDTIQVLVDLDVFDEWKLVRFRLLGCNAREKSMPGGEEARENLAQMLPRGTTVGVTSVKIDKFGGRYDAIIALPDGRDLVSVLVADGWAVRWDGRGQKPVPMWPRGYRVNRGRP